jgi:hypothetical protein
MPCGVSGAAVTTSKKPVPAVPLGRISAMLLKGSTTNCDQNSFVPMQKSEMASALALLDEACSAPLLLLGAWSGPLLKRLLGSAWLVLLGSAWKRLLGAWNADANAQQRTQQRA